jgi:hypothetical protein
MKKVYVEHLVKGRGARKPPDELHRLAFKRLEEIFGKSQAGGHFSMRVWWIRQEDLEEFQRLADPYEVHVAY